MHLETDSAFQYSIVLKRRSYFSSRQEQTGEGNSKTVKALDIGVSVYFIMEILLLPLLLAVSMLTPCHV